ncbi:hypothetical protein CSUI_005998 [Cystoisospora suis]|uniref:Uncharacterized protein n=1 Tax=Cystoisospora suis TaxID=483139 RepID=A0A2C6KV38_9APIC|nr:hypothetical protein CSUI_005998 [Cystoisospora suis]
MKLRRKFVEGKYASLVEEIYNKSAIPPCIAAQTSKTANHPGGGEQEATPTEESRDIQICSSHGKEAKKREGGEEDPKELLHRQQPPTKRMAKL